MSLTKRIYLVLSLIGLALLFTTMTFFAMDEKRLAENFAKQNLKSLALNYFDSVNTMMLTGTVLNRQIIQEKIQTQENIVEARIIRAPALIDTFGAGNPDQGVQTDFEQQGLSSGLSAYDYSEKEGERILSFIQPIKASADYRGTNCLSCHSVASGTVLGAVKVSYSLAQVDAEIASSITKAGILQLIITVLGFGLLSLVFNHMVLRRLKRLRDTIEHLEQDLDLNQEIHVTHHDELGAVSSALNRMIVKFRESLVAVSSATDRLIHSAQSVDEISSLTKDAMLSNKNGTDSVAAAINELDATATEVQYTTKTAADKSESANEKASRGLVLIQQAKDGINQLRDQVSENTDMIAQLSDKTHEVGSVLEVITGIAEQTNLLALNAAIEAARAGEQGRGFAVVADEVRSLATRTRESINQIQDTISVLQVDASQAVESMHSVSEQASDKAEDVNNVAGLLTDISGQISELETLNTQIASAAEQQNLAAEEINQNVVNISDVAEQSTQDATRGKEISEALLGLAYELSQQLSKFKF